MGKFKSLKFIYLIFPTIHPFFQFMYHDHLFIIHLINQ